MEEGEGDAVAKREAKGKGFAGPVSEEDPLYVEEGPYDKSLLVEYETHISHDIWRGAKGGKIKTICHTNNMFEWELTPQMCRYLEEWGFGIFTKRSSMLHNDTALVNALVERWRRETNSFFFPSGEMTVTLEDVYFILNIPIFGNAVTCDKIKDPKGYWLKNWFEELIPDDCVDAYNRGGVLLSWIRSRYAKLPKDERKHTPEMILLHSRAYLFYMLGSVLFPNRSGDAVHPRYLAMLGDISTIRDYAWGAAVLAYLYRGLGEAAQLHSISIAACLPLLLVWCYERIPIGRPIRPWCSQYIFPRAVGWAYNYYEMPEARFRR